MCPNFGKQLLNKLKRENILFLDPINASRFVNKNFDELSLWWAKKIFFETNKKQTALISDNYLDEWNRIFYIRKL